MTTTQLLPLSACVTRILSLSGFSPELKTRDVQQAFMDWENVQGGFKIKWVDDTSLFIVFQDPTIAKRAYLQMLLSPPPIFTSPTSTQEAKIRPYDGPDAQTVIQAVNSRNNNDRVRGHNSRASIAVGGGINGAHARMGSGNSRNNNNGYDGQLITIPSPGAGGMNNREPSPTLPSLPSQPTLNSLISSSLSAEHLANVITETGPPRIGDPGKRMVAHSLGVKHPALSRSYSGDELTARVRDLQRGMHSMSVTE